MWLWHRNYYPGPTEHMGTGGICPQLILADTLTLFMADYAHRIGLSRAVGRSENPGVPMQYRCGGIIGPPWLR